MPRPGVTYDQVAAAADALVAETGAARLRAVRDKLGTGSPNTIHRHLEVWQANRPKEAAPAMEIPAELTRGIQAWVVQASTTARAEAEERLVHLQAEAAELAKAGEDLEAERDAQAEQIAAITTERDQAQAMASARAAEIERMQAEVDRERALAGAAQVAAAEAKLKAESQTEQLADLKAEVKRLNEALATEVAKRTQAEKQAAVLEAERDAARKEADEERQRIRGLQAHLDKAHQDMEALRGKSADEIKELREQAESRVAAAIKAEREAVDRERTASVENASLKAQLAAAQKKEEGSESAAQKGFRKN